MREIRSERRAAAGAGADIDERSERARDLLCDVGGALVGLHIGLRRAVGGVRDAQSIDLRALDHGDALSRKVASIFSEPEHRDAGMRTIVEDLSDSAAIDVEGFVDDQDNVRQRIGATPGASKLREACAYERREASEELVVANGPATTEGPSRSAARACRVGKPRQPTPVGLVCGRVHDGDRDLGRAVQHRRLHQQPARDRACCGKRTAEAGRAVASIDDNGFVLKGAEVGEDRFGFESQAGISARRDLDSGHRIARCRADAQLEKVRVTRTSLPQLDSAGSRGATSCSGGGVRSTASIASCARSCSTRSRRQ